MDYKRIPDEAKGIYYITNKDSYMFTKKSTLNLADNERMIAELTVRECPVHKSCVSRVGFEKNISAYCQFVGNYPIIVNDEPALSKLNCQHGGDEGKDIDVTIISVENCPIDLTNCMDCQHLKNIIIPAQDNNKSHCHIVCDHK